MAALTAALLGLTAANAVSGAVGQRKAAKAAQQQGNYEGSIFDMNAGVADKQAADALARGDQAVSESRAQSRGLTGSQRASQAAEGIDITSGSAADVQNNDAALGELDRLTLAQNAQREAFGYKVEAANARAQGNLARMGGRNQASSLRNAATGTLLNGAMELYNIYDAYGKTSGGTPRKKASTGSSSASTGGYHNGTAAP